MAPRLLVVDVMTTPPLRLDVDTPVDEAAQVARTVPYRSLPVVADGQLKGLVETAALKGSPPEGVRTVGDLPLQPAPTIRSAEPLLRAVETLVETRRDALYVLGPAGALVGVLTANDVLRYCARTWREEHDHAAPDPEHTLSPS